MNYNRTKMSYVRYPMTAEQLRESLVDWDNQDKITLMDNEFVHYLGESEAGLILETESLKQRYYIDVQHIKVQGISDIRGNWIAYYVPDDKGTYHLIRPIMNVTNELLKLLEPTPITDETEIVRCVYVRDENGCYRDKPGYPKVIKMKDYSKQ